MTGRNNDEINIIDFLEILERELLIIFCAFIGALIGFGFLTFIRTFELRHYIHLVLITILMKNLLLQKKSVNETFLQFVGDLELGKRKDGKSIFAN